MLFCFFILFGLQATWFLANNIYKGVKRPIFSFNFTISPINQIQTIKLGHCDCAKRESNDHGRLDYIYCNAVNSFGNLISNCEVKVFNVEQKFNTIKEGYKQTPK